jgi:hypothetical protein
VKLIEKGDFMNRTNSSRLARHQIYAGLAESSQGFSLLPLLLHGQSISSETRLALRENRIKDAAAILMKDYGLSCDEAGDLLNVSAC